MGAEYFRGSVKLNMDLNSAKKTISEKLCNNISQILVTFGFISWLIVLSIVLSLGLRNLQDENRSLQKEIDKNKIMLTELKNDLKMSRHQIGDLAEHLVDGFVPKYGKNENVTKLRKDVLKKISNDVYTKIGDFGHFHGFGHPMNYTHGKKSCQLINGHILEFDETDPNIHEFFVTIVEEFHKNEAVFDFWIGLTDLDNEGSFKWDFSEKYYSKIPSAMNLWSRGEPNHLKSENCVEVHDYREGKGKWLDIGNGYEILKSMRSASDIEKFTLRDVECDSYNYVICKKNPEGYSTRWGRWGYF